MRYLVLDEADKLLCSKAKHYKEVHDILNVIKNNWNINKYKKQFDISNKIDENENDNLME